MQKNPKHALVLTYLPWLLAAVGFVLYAVTVNRSVSLMGLPAMARATGLDWHPVYVGPLQYLLTYPVRWLPPDWQLAALNLFAAVCAGLVLALLARCVALLPHDRTREQRERLDEPSGLLSTGTAWIPPLFAVLVFGLQTSFWEHAVTWTGEMLDLLVFAYCVRCLLEFRLTDRESWLLRMAFVYGLGTATNWAMIGFFPGFLVAVVWLMGLEFFNLRFLLRMTACGAAGLLLYFLLPIVQATSDLTDASFFEALRINLNYQKKILQGFPKWVLLLTSLTSLLPVVFLSIRWPATFGDMTKAGQIAATLMGHLIHVALLGLCVYVAFDPPFSARMLGMGLPFLTFYFLGALSIGYYTGYLLLVFGQEPRRGWARPSAVEQIAKVLVPILVYVAVIAVPVLLVYRNYPLLRSKTSPALAHYVERLRRDLPPEPSVVMSDDPIRLYGLALSLDAAGQKRHVLLDSGSLLSPGYHRFLRQRYGDRLPVLSTNLLQGPVNQFTISHWDAVQYVTEASRRQPVYYIHPSFGYYFEAMYLEPKGAVYRLKEYPPDMVLAPLPNEQELNAGTAYWKQAEAEELGELGKAVARVTPTRESYSENLLWAGAFYSRALTHWGVVLQRANRFAEGTQCFRQALALNPQNACALINLEFSTNWLARRKPLEKFSDEVMRTLDPYRGNWEKLMSLNGPLDEPTVVSELGRVFLRNGLFRQSAQAVHRVLDYFPDELQTRLFLGHVFVMGQQPERALKVAGEIRARGNLDATNLVELVQLEAKAQFVKGDLPAAEAMLQEAQEKLPFLEGGFLALAQIYLASAEQLRTKGNTNEALVRMTNALTTMERQLQAQPRNVNALVNYGGLLLTLQAYDRGLQSLNRALELDPDNVAALMNRAIGYLRKGDLPAAKRDYDQIKAKHPTMFQAYYGLGEVAYREGKWQEAIDHYKDYLKLAPESSETAFVRERLRELEKKAS